MSIRMYKCTSEYILEETERTAFLLVHWQLVLEGRSQGIEVAGRFIFAIGPLRTVESVSRSVWISNFS